MPHTHHDANAGMPKRVYAEYAPRSSDYTGGLGSGRAYPKYSRSQSGSKVSSRRYAGARRYASNRFYQGRGVRSGTAQLRRYRGLPRAPGLGIETKFYDSLLSNAAVAVGAATAAWTGNELNPTTFLCLNCPTQGTGASNREGRFITMESLQLTGSLRWNSQADQTAADTIPVAKLWVVLDKQTNGGTATGLDSENVYTNPVATAVGSVTPLRNMLFSKRYKVLREIECKPPALIPAYDGTNMEQLGSDVCFDAFIPLKGIKTEFTANAGSVADISTNALFVVGCCSNTTVTINVSYNARLRFRG